MSKIRRFSKIEIENDDFLKLTYRDKEKDAVVINIDNLEAIIMSDNNCIKFYGTSCGELNATFEDCLQLRNVISQSFKFVICGDAVFVLNKVIDCNKDARRGSVIVDCEYGSYEINLYHKFEKANDLFCALQKKYQKGLNTKFTMDT